MIIKHKEKVLEWLVVVLLLGGVLYSATTAWKNETRLATVGEDVRSIKHSMISLLLEDSPDKTGIAKDLLGSTELLQGVESFKLGHFKAAYQNWEMAARKGDMDAVYAIEVANDALRKKVTDPGTTESQREELREALDSAPKVEEEYGAYMLPSTENAE